MNIEHLIETSMATKFLIGLANDMFFSAIPAVGFALLFNVPKKALKYCAIGGVLGHSSRYILLHLGMPLELATLFSATLVGFIGVHWAHHFLAHPKIFTVAAVIPMVPGIFAFRSMIAFVELSQRGFSIELLSTLIDNFLKALFIVAALTIGLAMPGLLFYRRKPIV